MDLAAKRWTLTLACVGGFMLILDLTVVNVALPRMQAELNASLDELQWVINAYALTLGALLLTAGSLADLLQRRVAFAAGVGAFTVASLLCGLAPSPLLLDLFRGLQGATGALVSASALALIGQEFQGAARNGALGVFGGVSGAATALGPLVGGALVQWAGWRGVFFINVPIGVLMVALSTRLPRTAPATAADGGRGPALLRRLDWPGALTFSGAVFGLNLFLTRGNEDGWTSLRALGIVAAALVLLCLFAAAELARARPMLDLRLFRRPGFVAAIVTSFTARAATFGLVFFLTLYLQGLLGLSPIQAGLRLLPLTALIVAGALAAAAALARVGAAVTFGIGFAALAAGLFAARAVGVDSDWTVLLPALLLIGAGAGILSAPVLSVAMGELPPERAGLASAINTTFLPLGTATGVAIVGAVFQHQVSSRLAAPPPGGAGLPATLAGQIAQAVSTGRVPGPPPGLPPAAAAHFLDVARQSFVAGLQVGAVATGAMAIVGGAATVVLLAQRQRHLAAPGAAGAERIGGEVRDDRT